MSENDETIYGVTLIHSIREALRSCSIGLLSLSRLSKFSDGMIATFCVVGIFWMPLYFFISGITVTTYLEESVGYRYFYSLRYAFGHENSWLPQGQLMVVYDAMLQFLLSFFGLPNNQLFPRIDIFCLIANMLPILLTGLAFFRLSKSFDQKSWPLCIAVVLIFMMQSRDLPGQWSWTLMPDYHVWVVPLAIFSATLLPCFRKNLIQQELKPTSWFIWMGALVGAAAGIKLTFMLFPLTVILVWSLCFNNWRHTVKALFIAAILCILTILIILWANTIFSEKGSIQNYIEHTINFAKTQSGTLVGTALPSHIESLLPFLLSVLGLVIGILWQRLSLFTLGFTGVLYTIFVIMRPYSHSLVEYHGFMLISFVPLIRTYHEYCALNARRSRRIEVILLSFSALTLMVIIQQSWSFICGVPQGYRILGNAAAEFHRRLEIGPKPTWILFSDNAHHPNSIESALCKGGMDISHTQWGDSPYIEKLFPTFHCAVLAATLTNSDKKTMLSGTIGFSHFLNEPLAMAVAHIEKDFHISLENADCKDVVGDYGSPFAYCYSKSGSVAKIPFEG